MASIKEFNNETEYNQFYNSSSYSTPHVSTSVDTSRGNVILRYDSGRITFKIGDRTCRAESNTYWYNWIGGRYDNTGMQAAGATEIWDADGSHYLTYNGTAVKPGTDKIIANATYVWTLMPTSSN